MSRAPQLTLLFVVCATCATLLRRQTFCMFHCSIYCRAENMMTNEWYLASFCPKRVWREKTTRLNYLSPFSCPFVPLSLYFAFIPTTLLNTSSNYFTPITASHWYHCLLQHFYNMATQLTPSKQVRLPSPPRTSPIFLSLHTDKIQCRRLPA